MTVLHNPGGLGFRIEALYAFLAVHADGDEGVVGATIDGSLVPLIGADLERVEALRPLAVEAGRAAGMPIALVRFDRRVELEQIPPA